MDITRFVDGLRRDLSGAAEAAGPEGQQAAERILLALEPAVRLTVMEVLAQAAAEISADLPAGVVEVRLRGRDPELVVDVPPVPPVPPTPPPAPSAPDAGVGDPELGEDEGIARITLRLPESVKTRAEELAATSGHSLNAWIVNAVRAATNQRSINVDIDLSSIPFGGQPRRMSGWV
jgi:HicB family